MLKQLRLHYCTKQITVCFTDESQCNKCFSSKQIRWLQEAI